MLINSRKGYIVTNRSDGEFYAAVAVLAFIALGGAGTVLTLASLVTKVTVALYLLAMVYVWFEVIPNETAEQARASRLITLAILIAIELGMIFGSIFAVIGAVSAVVAAIVIVCAMLPWEA